MSAVSRPAPPDAFATPDGVVVLRGAALVRVAWAMKFAAERTRPDPASRAIEAMLRHAADAHLSASGRSIGSLEPTAGEFNSIGTQQAAKRLGVTERTVRRRATTLGGTNIGGAWVFDSAEIDRHAADAA